MASNTECPKFKDCTNCEAPAENKLSLTVQNCIENIVQKENFKHYSVEVKDISTNGGNYFGELQSVDIKGTGSDGDKEINIFVKNVVDCGNFDQFSLSEVYFRESFVYKELLMLYTKLQDDFNIPHEERYNILKSYNESNSEVIILENMTNKGFETFNRHDIISLEFAEKSVLQLARFHALSFALQQQQPRYFEKNIKTMRSIINFNPKWQNVLLKMCNVAIESLEGDAKMRMIDYIPVFLKNYEHYLKISDEDAVCLCHGDYRPNNILQKKIDGKIQEVFVIDYQFANYTTPVFDFIYFLFVGADQEFRNTHMEYLTEFYFDHFEKFLGYFGIDSDDVFSRKRFYRELREKLDFGLIYFVIISPFLFAPEEDVPDIKDVVNTESEYSMNNDYKARIREVVDFFIEAGYL